MRSPCVLLPRRIKSARALASVSGRGVHCVWCVLLDVPPCVLPEVPFFVPPLLGFVVLGRLVPVGFVLPFVGLAVCFLQYAMALLLLVPPHGAQPCGTY